jgi:hypothetical protein
VNFGRIHALRANGGYIARAMRHLAVLAFLVITACGSTTTASSTSPSPSASLPAAASPSPSPSPSPAASLPCKMPASLRDVGGNKEILGWLSLPSGATTDDPTVHVIEAGTLDGQPIWATDHSPQLYGYGVASWSTVTNGWVPVPPELLAPDGLHYAYLHPDGKIHLGNASSGAEAIVQNPNKLTPLAYTSAGVVLTSSDIPSSGLWLLDPATQTIVPITPRAGSDNWLEVANGVGFGTDSPGVLGYSPTKKVMSAAIVPNSNIISPSSTSQVVYTAPSGDAIALIAADVQGGLLVVNQGTTPGLVYLSPAGSPAPFQGLPGVNLAQLGPRHHADAHGIWFLGQTGIFLFSTTAGLQQIASGVKTDIVPGGDCV